jgi:iron complex transport system permease protein
MSATSAARSTQRLPILVPAVLSTGALLLLTLGLALSFGTERISLRRALFDTTSLDHVILVRARLPRVVLAAVSGGGLSIVGATFQALLRNPLAEPFVLGVSGGAALGTTIAVALGLGSMTVLGATIIPMAALAGGLGATALVYGLARSSRVYAGTEILLAGVIVNSMASAIITFIKTLVTPSKAQELLFWLTGYLDVPSIPGLIAVVVYVAIGVVALWLDSGHLNLLSLGEEPAAQLGVDVGALGRRVFLFSSLVVGAIVSLTGLIAFVGLVVPHAMRRILGPDLRILLPVCLFAGALALVLCDLIARASFVWFGTEPPVGAVTALIGGPVFLVLLRRRAA